MACISNISMRRMHKSVTMRTTFVCVVCISIYFIFSRFIFIIFNATATAAHCQNKCSDEAKERRAKSDEYKIKWNPFVVWFDCVATVFITYTIRATYRMMILSSQKKILFLTLPLHSRLPSPLTIFFSFSSRSRLQPVTTKAALFLRSALRSRTSAHLQCCLDFNGSTS